MKRVLVVYYSRSGNTRKAAEAIAKHLGADIEQIHDTTDRRGIRGLVKTFTGALSKKETLLRDARRKHSAYDLVIVGGPVWLGGPSAPVAAYLRAHKDAMKSVCFFCTRAVIAGPVFKRMEALCGKAPLETIAFGAMKDAHSHLAIIRFVDRVKAQMAKGA